MPFFTAEGRQSGEYVSLAPSDERTASGSGTPIAAAEKTDLRLNLAVTAASGTSPSLTVTIEHGPDGSTWTALGSFAAKTGVATEHKVFSGVDEYVRATWTVTGTNPHFTFSVDGALL